MTQFNIFKLHEKLVHGETTSKELVEEVFERIEKTDDHLNAYITLNKEAALEKAEAIDKEGIAEDELLKGIPYAPKDNILTKDLLTTSASKMLEDFIPTFDATVVERLEAAGMINIGKTNMDEFAMGGTGETSYYGKTHNPWSEKVVPGGSSSGAAATVAADHVPISLGTDTGGSIRQPASFNNLVGIKPSYGLVSRFGVVPLASSLDSIGLFSHTVKENAAVLQTMAGHDEKDAMSYPETDYNFLENIEAGVSGLKLGVVKEWRESDRIGKEVRDIMEAALKVYEELGAEIVEISLPYVNYGAILYDEIGTVEGSTSMQRFDGIRYGYRAEDVEDLEDLYVRSRTEGLGKEVKKRIIKGMHATSGDNKDRFHTQTGRVRTIIIEDYKKSFEKVDAIIAPTAVSPAYSFASDTATKTPQIGTSSDSEMDDNLTTTMNVAGLPALSVPAGFVEGLPVGLQIVGEPLSEALIYQIAYAFEQETKYYQELPEEWSGE